MANKHTVGRRNVAAGLAVFVAASFVVTVPLASQPAPRALSAQFVTFLEDTYLNGRIEAAEAIAENYAERVAYYGRTLSRSQVVADKLRYNRRWPKRAFVLDRDSVKVIRAGRDENAAEVRFTYDYTVSDARETRRGQGAARLNLTAKDGRLVITAEDGRVLRKF
jgi:hypothetical protein